MTSPDVGVCLRQAFGSGFSPRSNDSAIVQQLKEGRLQLNPHPIWQIPERLTWDEDPFGQRNWRAQLHMLRWLDPLRRAAAGGDGEAARAWWQYASSWLASERASEEGHPFAWMDMVDGVRAKELVLGFPLVPETHHPMYLDALRKHGAWLADLSHRGHSNHAMHQLLGLLLTGRFLRHAEWVEQSVAQLGELLEHEYDEEGVNREGAIAYHLHNYSWWRDVLKALTEEGLPLPSAAARLDAARLQLVHATRPDGLLETIGDTARAPMKLKDSAEMLYVSTSGADGTPPSSTFASYGAGYIFGRSGWGQYEQDFDQETFYSVAHGTGVKVHGHDEAGAVTYYSKGSPWLVDPGKYAYVSDEFRRHIVSRAAHNLVHLPGEPRRADAAVTVSRVHHSSLADDILLKDHGYEGVELRRRIVFHRPSEALVVIDSVRADRPVRAVQTWQLAPNVDVTPHKNGFRLSKAEAALKIVWTGRLPNHTVSTGESDPFRGWVSEGWMDATPAPAIAAVQEGLSFRLVTILGPERSGRFDLVTAVTLPGGIGLRLSSGSAVHEFSIEATGVSGGLKEPAKTSIRAPWRASAIRRLLESHAAAEAPTVPDRTLMRLTREAVVADASAPNRARWAATVTRRLLSSDGEGLAGDDGLASALVDAVGSAADPEVLALLQERLPNRRPTLAPPGAQLRVQGGAIVRDHDAGLRRLAADPTRVVHASQLVQGLVMPWAARGGDGDVLLVRLHGAVDRQRLTVPAWPALTSATRGSCPFLIVQDPALDLNASMRLSWYLGGDHTDGHVCLANLIVEVLRATGTSRALVVGSSGGGFAALQTAAISPRVTALAFNPQTDLRAYHRPAANTAAQSVIGVENIDAVSEPRISALGRWRQAAHKSRAVIVSNIGDTMHDGRHVEPFRTAVELERLGDVRVHRIDSGPGHVAPKVDEMDGWINRVLETV